MKKTIIIATILTYLSFAFSQSVDIKDSDSNSLITINDEGSAGSITVPDATTVGTTTNKLYNEGSTLKWNGSALATGASIWSLNGSDAYYNTGNVGIGTISPLSRLSVGGDGFPFMAIYGSSSNTGIFGNSTGGNGIEGRTAFGCAVRGSATSGDSFDGKGGYFSSYGQTGIGVLGYAEHSSGVNYGVKGQTNSPNGYAGYFDGRGYFSGNVGIGTDNPTTKLDVNGDVKIGENGTKFLEIQEITGVTGTGTGTLYTDKLPVGWTGATTRVLSMELQFNSDTGGWYSSGYHYIVGGDEIAYDMIHFNRNVTIHYPDVSYFHGRTWRMMIMKMP